MPVKSLFWLVGLAAVAVAFALLMGQNGATVTVFWHPHRVDMSFNLVLVAGVLLFLLLYLALRSLALLRSLPQQARQWRLRQRERLAHAAVLDALSHQLAGRFVRARGAARDAVAHLQLVAGAPALPRQAQMLTLAHLLAAEAAHTLQDHAARDKHLAQALVPQTGAEAGATREGALLRAIRWAVEERNVSAATQLLAQLPQGAARRTLALRLKLRVARLAQDNQMALETARLLAKHRAFSPQAARSMVRGLVLAALSDTHDAAQVQAAWAALDSQDRRDPDVVVAVVQRMRDVADAQDGGAALALARQWVLPVWEGYPGLGVSHQVALVRLLPLLGMAGEVPWLARIENMQREHPADPLLQYLAAEVFFQQRLWGKAAHLFQQASRGLGDARLRGAAWCRLAELAEERGDTVAALAAWRQAASGLSPLA
jgi:HemY protein